jgi:hypothetical protein
MASLVSLYVVIAPQGHFLRMNGIILQAASEAKQYQPV